MATRITRYQHSLWKRTAFASPIAASEKRRACPSYSINTLWVTLIAGILLSQMAWLKDAKSSFSITLEWLVQRERFRGPSRDGDECRPLHRCAWIISSGHFGLLHRLDGGSDDRAAAAGTRPQTHPRRKRTAQWRKCSSDTRIAGDLWQEVHQPR